MSRAEWEIISAYEIMKYANRKGFNNAIRFEKDFLENPYVFKKNIPYLRLEELSGKKLDLDNSEDIIKLAKLLGGFHECCEGFEKPSGIKINTLWGKKIEKYRTMTRRVARYLNKLVPTAINNNFEERIYSLRETLMEKAAVSIKLFGSREYLSTLEKSMENREIAFNAITNNSAVINNEGVYLVDIFDVGYNLALEDLCSLIKRGSQKNNSNYIYARTIEAYSSIRGLEENSENIIKSMITFPYDSMKVIIKYLDKKIDGEFALEKFEKYYEKEKELIFWR